MARLGGERGDFLRAALRFDFDGLDPFGKGRGGGRLDFWDVADKSLAGVGESTNSMSKDSRNIAESLNGGLGNSALAEVCFFFAPVRCFSFDLLTEPHHRERPY
jgi:hypothetical protein